MASAADLIQRRQRSEFQCEFSNLNISKHAQISYSLLS